MSVSHADAKRYDRQIRLWGLEGQRRIQQARILFIRPRGLMTEVIKNVVLAGVCSVTLWDDARIHADAFEFGCNFFLQPPVHESEFSVENMRPHVHALNPQVHVETWTDAIDAEAIRRRTSHHDFDVVCLTHIDWDLTLSVSEHCHASHLKLYVAACDALEAWIFCDVGKHHEWMPPGKQEQQHGEWLKLTDAFDHHCQVLKNSKKSVKALRRVYPPVFLRLLLHYLHRQGKVEDLLQRQALFPDRPELADMLLPLKYLQEWTPNVDMSAVCSIVGGILAQDMIHVIAGSHRPIRSFFLFDGREFSGILV